MDIDLIFKTALIRELSAESWEQDIALELYQNIGTVDYGSGIQECIYDVNPLCYIASSKCVSDIEKKIKFLIEKCGANVNYVTKEGKNALLYALQKDHGNAVKILANYGCKLYTDIDNVLKYVNDDMVRMRILSDIVYYEYMKVIKPVDIDIKPEIVQHDVNTESINETEPVKKDIEIELTDQFKICGISKTSTIKYEDLNLDALSVKYVYINDGKLYRVKY